VIASAKRSPAVPSSAACIALSAYAAVCSAPDTSTPARALTVAERQTVLDHLHSERFRDKAPAEVYATLIDEGIYLCSIRTMYRILAESGELKERRNQLRHPQYTKRSC